MKKLTVLIPGFVVKLLSTSVIFLVLFFFSSVPLYAQSTTIRVTGFSSPRSYVPLRGFISSEYMYKDYATRLVGQLQDPLNFGVSGVAKCGISFLSFVNIIATNSLVENGVRKADVFFTGPIITPLSSTEANELKAFLLAGGTVHLSENWYSDELGSNFNLLFSTLGIGDYISDDTDARSFMGETNDPPDISPFTNGAFGTVGPLAHPPFKHIITSSLTPLAHGFEKITGFIGMSLPADPVILSDTKYTILAEKQFGSGYLSVSGGPLYFNSDIADNINNKRYFLNMFAKSCPVTSGKQLDVPLYKQTNSAWSSQEYDSGSIQKLWCGKTIGQCGCAMSSAAMVLSYYGVTKGPDGKDTNPENLNSYLKKNSLKIVCDRTSDGKPIYGYSSNGYVCGNISWSTIDKYSADANKIYNTQKIIWQSTDLGYTKSKVSDDIKSDRPVILAVPGHFVVATGELDSTFAINDPGYSRTRLDVTAYNNTAKGVRRFVKTSSDFSRLIIAIAANDNVAVTDSEGNKTGFDMLSSQPIFDIPDSTYFFEESYHDVTSENPPPPPGKGVNWLVIDTPKAGKYDVEVFAPSGEDYSFAVYAYTQDADLKHIGLSGKTDEGISEKFSLNYDPEDIEDNFFLDISIDVEPGNTANRINHKSKGNIQVTLLSSPTFNAPLLVDRNSLTFGRVGNEHSLHKCLPSDRDVNSDGLKDLTCLFSLKKTDFRKGDSKAYLEGQTSENLKIKGEDNIYVF